MATPNDNTEVLRMFRDVKNSLWKSITPLKTSGPPNFIFSHTKPTMDGKTGVNDLSVATRLNFTNLDDSRTISDSFLHRVTETPESLKRKLINTEAELKTSKAKIKEKESFISIMEPVNKKICMSLENELQKCKRTMEFDSQKFEELASQLKWSKLQYSNAKKQIHELEQQKKVEWDQLNRRVLSLQQECSDLKVEVADVKSEKTEAVRKLNMEIGKLELKVRMLNEEAENSQDYIQSLKRQNSEMAEKVGLCNSYQIELKEAKAKINALENKIEADKDASLIVASRQKDLEKLTELERANAILKDEVNKYRESNILLYQEKMWSLQEKLNQAEHKCAGIPKLQLDNEQLKRRLNQWEDLLDDKSAPFKSPTAFSRKLSQYQQNEAVLTNKLAQLTSHCELTEKQKSEKEATIKSLNQRLEQNQLALGRQDSVIKRSQRKISILTQEKENYRKLLDSYLCDATLCGSSLNNEQVQQLEEINAEYKTALEKSEKEIEFLSEKLKNVAENQVSNELVAEKNKLRSDNASLTLQLKELKAEIINLQSKKDSKQQEICERVLHLRMNPVASARERHLQHMKQVLEENDQLKKRVKVLEEEGRAACDVTMKVRERLETEGADSTLQALRTQLSAAERQKMFILESAKTKSTEFREAVYRLTGYRIDMLQNKQYKLSNLYAESRDDHLLFQVDKDIQLIETDYSNQMSEKIQLYLHQYDSFPAFLASLTLDLFNQQTVMLQ